MPGSGSARCSQATTPPPPTPSSALIHRRQQRVPPELTLAEDLVTMVRHPVSSAGFLLTRRHRPRWLIREVKLQAIVEPDPDPTARVALDRARP